VGRVIGAGKINTWHVVAQDRIEIAGRRRTQAMLSSWLLDMANIVFLQSLEEGGECLAIIGMAASHGE
jgi:hypothetical protein